MALEDTSQVDKLTESGSILDTLPGGITVWIFFVVEILTFALFFIGYAWLSRSEPEVFSSSQAMLNPLLGTINTLVLLTGSWAAARGVAAFRKSESLGAWFYACGLSGLIFLAVKGSEYVHVFQHGISLSTNTFWFFYLFLTFFHAMHIVLGVFFVVFLNIKHSPKFNFKTNSESLLEVEAAAVYWHLVDIIWVFLFALVYLLR